MGFDYKTIQFENKNHGIWQLTINRPEALNALNSTVLNEMAEVIRQISEMDFESAKALIITGSGEKSFVAGADIKEMTEMNEDQAMQFARRGQTIFHELNLLKIPVVAAVNGFALGGGLELALGCDFIIASQNAKFALPEVGLGLIPGFGGTVRLTRAVGIRKAKELIMTGDMVTADEAYRLGLVNQVVPLADLLPTAYKKVETILLRSPLAVGQAKKSVNEAIDLDIDQALKNEAEIFAELFTSNDTREGTKAFVEKRKPQFSGQ